MLQYREPSNAQRARALHLAAALATRLLVEAGGEKPQASCDACAKVILRGVRYVASQVLYSRVLSIRHLDIMRVLHFKVCRAF